MKRSDLGVALLVATVASAPLPAIAQQPTAAEIVRRAWWAGKLDGAEMVSTLVIKNDRGQQRVRKTVSISKLYDGGQTEKQLIRFLAPADVKGTGVLTFDYEKKDDAIWFFLPSLRKTRRIVSSEKSKSFMGSEFTYGDLTPASPEDFHHKLLRAEPVAGVDCWVIEVLPRAARIADDHGFSRKLIWFGKQDYIARRVESFDLKGKLARQLSAEDVRQVDRKKHRYRPMRMKVLNVQTRRSSELTIDKIQLRAEIPDEYFTTRYLERV